MIYKCDLPLISLIEIAHMQSHRITTVREDNFTLITSSSLSRHPRLPSIRSGNDCHHNGF